MESLINIDKNMIVTDTVGDYEVLWRNVKDEPFALHGMYEPRTEPIFHRLPTEVAEATSIGVASLEKEASGGRVRFSTNSPYIDIRVKYKVLGRAPHISLLSSAGFDLFCDSEWGSRFISTFRMPYDTKDSYRQIALMEDPQERSYTVYFPTHSVIESLEIGLSPDASLNAPYPYRDVKPVVFYGSSIVHGTAAGRCGSIYPAIVSRELNVDFINLGFSGSAKGEDAIAEYIAGLDMSVFVCDYDHNAKTPEDLESTHFRMYETVRKKNPKVPYIMITRPDFWTQQNQKEHVLARRDVVMRSYLKARALGDKNVYFIDGLSFNAGPYKYEATVDGIHPGDHGFVNMARVIGDMVKYVLQQ